MHYVNVVVQNRIRGQEKRCPFVLNKAQITDRVWMSVDVWLPLFWVTTVYVNLRTVVSTQLYARNRHKRHTCFSFRRACARACVRASGHASVCERRRSFNLYTCWLLGGEKRLMSVEGSCCCRQRCQTASYASGQPHTHTHKYSYTHTLTHSLSVCAVLLVTVCLQQQ